MTPLPSDNDASAIGLQTVMIELVKSVLEVLPHASECIRFINRYKAFELEMNFHILHISSFMPYLHLNWV
jgi:hypothetical protein